MLRHSFLALALVTVGCGSSDPESSPTADAAAEVLDTGKPDTGKADTGKVETAPLPGCESELPSDFACKAPTKTAGQTTCSEAALQDFVQKCLKDDLTVPATCNDWKTANPMCGACVSSWSWDGIPGKIYPDDYKCYWSTFDATCGKTVNCLFTCQDEVCQDCADGAERSECSQAADKSGGRCWDVAGKAADVCFKAADLTGCNVDEIYANAPKLATLQEQLLKFYRGACRDNADWKNATSAGADAGTDAGSADTSVSDAPDAG